MMKLLRLYEGRRFKYAVVDGRTGTHTCIKYDGWRWCSCVGFAVRKRCRHINLLDVEGLGKVMGMGDVLEIDELLKEEKKTVKKLSSSLGVLNALFGEEAYNSDEIFAVYGLPKVGKTLLCLQESVWFAHNNLNVLYIDTEGSIKEFVRKWLPIFDERFGGKAKRKGKILVTTKRSVEELCRFLGTEVKLERKGGKIEFRVEKELKKNEAFDIVKEKKIDVVIVDSITNPLRVFTSGQQDNPAKADATAQIMARLMEVIDRFGVVVITTHHASFNPAQPYSNITAMGMRGGIVVHHTCKRVVYLDKREATEFRDYRRFWLVRAEDMPEWSRAVVAKITDVGYIDVKDESEIKKVFTPTEIKKLGGE